MATKAVKGVDEEAWNAIKSFAAKEGISMGEYFNELANDLKEVNSKSRWDKILASRVKHSEKEWAEIEKNITYFRKNFKMREFK